MLSAAILAAAPDDVAVSYRKVLAKDGVALALYRYAPPLGGAGHPPILLIADFGMGRSVFDHQGVGFARWLAAQGRLTYVAELRGQGKAAGVPWSAAEMVEKDLPAIAAAIGEGPFDVVAHGWAGTLVLAASVEELQGRVRKVIALSTPAEFAVPSQLAESVLVAGGHLGSLNTDPEAAKIFELLFAMGASIPSERLIALRANGFDDLGVRGAASLLQWMREGDLKLATGESLKARLKRYDRPTFQVMGLADGWANPELCAVLRDVTAAKVSLRVFSRFDFIAEDYSHLSILQGDGAPKEVYAPALKFLDEAAR
jgi:pimeloyl-ACP methyl ester carboxylesterase